MDASEILKKIGAYFFSITRTVVLPRWGILYYPHLGPSPSPSLFKRVTRRKISISWNMPYNRRYRKSYRKKRARGRFTRTRRTFAARVKKVLNRKTETKMWQVGRENVQLYHDVGNGSGPTTNQIPVEWNIWNNIAVGPQNYQRIGDKINPVMMVCRLWMATKADRPHQFFRIIVARVPKAINGVLSASNNIDLFRPDHAGSNGNTVCGFINSEKGIRAYYDRLVNINDAGQRMTSQDTFLGAEAHLFKKLVIRRKNAKPLLYEPSGQLVNNPVGIWIIPYDSYGTLQTDNISSCAITTRLYYKDP